MSVFALLGFVIISWLFFGVCDGTVDCKLHLFNSVTDFAIALFMAVVIVLKIEFDIRKLRLWKFFKDVNTDLTIAYSLVNSSVKNALGFTPVVITKTDLIKIINHIKNNEHLVLDAVPLTIYQRVRYSIAKLEDALNQQEEDLTNKVYVDLDKLVKQLLNDSKPPSYLMLAAKWTRS